VIIFGITLRLEQATVVLIDDNAVMMMMLSCCSCKSSLTNLYSLLHIAVGCVHDDILFQIGKK
jgi:hypothetical protein